MRDEKGIGERRRKKEEKRCDEKGIKGIKRDNEG